ncbi:hypothetical protein B0H13DRAFT_2305444 [Mycena leptocephala]|nr:hypothetical protein B0H13DRAFT_2305444 [Mycena leptocephala]
MEAIVEAESDRVALPLLHSDYLLIPANEPSIAFPRDGPSTFSLPQRATDDQPPVALPDASRGVPLPASVLGKRCGLSNETLELPPSSGQAPSVINAPPMLPISAKALGKRRGIEPGSPIRSGPPFSPEPNAGSLQTQQNLPGYGGSLTPTSLIVLPVRLQDTPVNETGDCDQFVSTYTLNRFYQCVRVQSARSSIRKGCLAATCSNVSLFAKQFTHPGLARLVEIAASHDLQTSTRAATLLAAIIAHDCHPACPGYSAVMLFDRLDRPRTGQVHSQLELDLIFDNDPRDDETGYMSTYTLNRRYEYKDVGREVDMRNQYRTSFRHIICASPDLGEFTNHYRFINLKNLAKIARFHCIECEQTKPALLKAFTTHVCTTDCVDLRLFFARMMYPRKGKFPVHKPGEDVVSSELLPPTSTLDLLHPNSMEDLGVVPIVVDTSVQLDSRDGRDFMSTYLLNSSYDFVGVISDISLRTIDKDDLGTRYVAAHVSSVATFVTAYHHLTVKQLAMMCGLHGFKSPTKKPDLLVALMAHECDAQCEGNRAVFLFQPAKKIRENIYPIKTVALIRADETACRTEFDRRVDAKAAGSASLSKLPTKEATALAVEEARNKFPQLNTIGFCHSIAKEWQDEMNPLKWLPAPCAICGRRTCPQHRADLRSFEAAATLESNFAVGRISNGNY